MNRYLFIENGILKINDNVNEEEILLDKEEICDLFKDKRENVSKYIREIFKEDSINKNLIYKNILKDKCYNLDVIIRVGFMVKNKIGDAFRYNYINLIKNDVSNVNILKKNNSEYLDYKNISNSIDKIIENDDYTDMLNIIKCYTKALNILDDYDNKKLKKPFGNKSSKKINYFECKQIIQNMSLNETSKIFGIERDLGLDSIINNIYQSFKGKDVYPTIEEKACNLLYLIIKNHVFIDGNKRIGAILFIYFLNFYDLLNKNNRNVISSQTLVVTSLFIAQSNPREKETIIELLLNLLDINY